MLKDMEPAVKDAVLTETNTGTKRWLQMGVELEGSWSSRKTTAAVCRGAKVHEDRSVHIGHGDPGEIITRPHDNLEDLCRDITQLWPDTVNDSCGFHIHASFTPIDTGILASREFYQYFKDQWVIWGTKQKLDRGHEFWGRLAGRNKHALDKFVPNEQLAGYRGAGQDGRRYTILNFYSWEKHKTIECRLLPMFTDVALGISAVQHLSEIYNTWLSRTAFKPLVLTPNVVLQDGVVEENYTVPMPDVTPASWVAEGSFPALPTGEDIYYSIPGAEHQMLPFRTEIKVQTP